MICIVAIYCILPTVLQQHVLYQKAFADRDAPKFWPLLTSQVSCYGLTL